MCSAYIDVLTVSMTSKIAWAEPPAVAMPSKFGKLWPRDREPVRITIIIYNAGHHSSELVQWNVICLNAKW